MAIFLLPSNVIISEVSVVHNTPNFTTEALNLTQKSRGRGLHRLEGSFTVTIGDDIQAQKSWTAFLLKLQGKLNAFSMKLPRHFASDNLFTNPQFTTSAGVGSTIINISGQGYKYAGSCFNVLNDTKIHYLLDDHNGVGDVEIYPPLRVAQPINAVLEFIKPVITCKLDTDKPAVNFIENGLVVQQTINFVEVV